MPASLSTLEPLGAQQCRQEVDEQENDNDGGQHNHDCSLLNALAGSRESEHHSHNQQAQDKQGRQPGRQVHVLILQR
jgi:hypothetical protein